MMRGVDYPRCNAWVRRNFRTPVLIHPAWLDAEADDLADEPDEGDDVAQ